MMKIGLIGSSSFYNTYKQELAKHPHLHICDECNIGDALQNTAAWENILSSCQYLFFETIDSSCFQLVNGGLKNGKHIIIDKADIAIDEMREMYNISNEGNLKCLLLPASDYYRFFEPAQNSIRNPFLIEIESEFGHGKISCLNDHISDTIRTSVENLLALFKSDIKQITVKQTKIFAEQTDLMTLQLDFSNGCFVNIKLSALDSSPAHSIKLYQHTCIYDINLTQATANTTTKSDEILSFIHSSSPEIDIIEKKIQHILTICQDNKSHTHSILDNFLVLELSAKILKKINSLHD